MRSRCSSAANDDVDIVLGSRFLGDRPSGHDEAEGRRSYGSAAAFSRMTTGVNLTDPQSACAPSIVASPRASA